MGLQSRELPTSYLSTYLAYLPATQVIDGIVAKLTREKGRRRGVERGCYLATPLPYDG